MAPFLYHPAYLQGRWGDGEFVTGRNRGSGKLRNEVVGNSVPEQCFMLNFETLSRFVKTGATIWALMAILTVPAVLGVTEWTLQQAGLQFSPSIGGYDALFVGVGLSPFCGALHGYIVYRYQAWLYSPGRPSFGESQEHDVRFFRFAIGCGIVLWAGFGLWISSMCFLGDKLSMEAIVHAGLTGALVGGVFGFIAGYLLVWFVIGKMA